MHAFLVVGEIGNRIEELEKSLGAKEIEFPIAKIEESRNLNKLLRLGFSEKTLIICRNINEATEEALNAFLKNLEEPQENIYFVLTAPNEKSVLSTIVSRCQVIKGIRKEELEISDETKKFITMNKSQQLSLLDKIKDRNVAIKFIEDLIYYLHSKKEFINMEILLTTLSSLKKNGNVSLHLTNLVGRMESTYGEDDNSYYG
jgi:DNA polymerase III delta prime subunit